MSEAKMTGRKVNKPGCATVRNQVTALFSLPMRLGQHVVLILIRNGPHEESRRSEGVSSIHFGVA